MKSPFESEFITDLIGSTLTIALVLFAFLVLFGNRAEAFHLEHTPAVAELAEAQAVASKDLNAVQKDLRAKLEAWLDREIELDLEKVPDTPLISDSGASRHIAPASDL